MDAAWKSRYHLAIEVARAAGQFAMQYFDRPVSVELKGDRSPVTIADRGAESLLRERISRAFPGDAFLGEEEGESPGTTGFRWVLDPVDGTRSFVRGVPLWATLVGLEYKGEQIAGVAYAPALGPMWRALRGDGAFRDDQKIAVSDVATFDRAHLYYSSISYLKRAGKEQMFLNLASMTERQRGYGDFYGFVLVAQGAGEIMFEHGCHVWDLAALKVIVEEAGGKMTNWQGQPTIQDPDVLASNGRLHAATVAILQEK